MNGDVQIEAIRRIALQSHYRWARAMALEHSRLSTLTDQARHVLAAEPGGATEDEGAAIRPEVEDALYVQYLAWRRVLSGGTGGRSLTPLSNEEMQLANKRWRREFAELVLFDQIRTRDASDDARDVTRDSAGDEFELSISREDWAFPAPIDPAAGSGAFAAETAAALNEALTRKNQGSSAASPSGAAEGRQGDYSLARRAVETEERRRRRIEGEPWDCADPEGPEHGA